jgi:ABC-type transport system involved in multi-copper enzyme maturation permease subunit
MRVRHSLTYGYGATLSPLPLGGNNRAEPYWLGREWVAPADVRSSRRREVTLLIGPIFTREALMAPRRVRFFVTRATYGAALLVLMWTAWQSVIGWQQVRNLGDLARFGSLLFQLLSFVQLVLVLFFSALLAAAAVAQEKDRRTLILLLMTDLTNAELVLGKLFASLLFVLVLLAAAVPIFAISLLLGGVAPRQVFWVVTATAAAALAAASLGSTVALWREKTFQTLALTTLILVLYLGVVEAAVKLGGEGSFLSLSAEAWAARLNPFRAVMAILDPLQWTAAGGAVFAHPTLGFVAAMLAWSLLLNTIATVRIRAWNSGGAAREERETKGDEGPAHGRGGAHVESDNPPVATRAAVALRPASTTIPARAEHRAKVRFEGPTAAPVSHAPSRHVWDNPILWREVRTRGYGRRPLLVKAAYLLVFAMVCTYFWMGLHAGPGRDPSLVTKTLVPIVVLTFLLSNAQAVTSVTTERDGRTLDLLLVTDITPKEFVFGKLAGTLYNAKEMLLLPPVMIGYLLFGRYIDWESFLYLTLGLLVLYGFVVMLGVHAGMTFDNSRTAIANSLGTIFFLFVGIGICIYLIVAAGSFAFEAQLPSFLVFILGGGVGLFASMGARNPSAAILLASLSLPFLTFYSIGSFLLGATLAVFLVTTVTYGFTTLAMLVPAISEFDVALGRTTVDEG